MFVMDSHTVRAIDAATIQAGVAGSVLMERAGAGATRELLARPTWLWGTTLVICGRGNNGGDGLVVARLLHGQGYAVEALLLADESQFEGDAATNLVRARESGVPLVELGGDAANALRARDREQPGRLLVDAALGTGFRPPLQGRMLEVVEAMNGLGRRRVALDAPSGLDASTGAVQPMAVRADLSVSFGFAKWGLFLDPGRGYCGQISVVDLEFPPELVRAQIELSDQSALYVDARLAAGWWRPRAIDAHKYSVGSLLVVGGSEGMSGAISLAGLGALRSGAGLVESIVPGSQRLAVDLNCIEVLVHGVAEGGSGGLSPAARDEILARAARHGAVLLGPGAGAELGAARLMVELCEALELPTVVDADALNAFSRLQREPRFPKRCVLTPHSGELARLLDVEVSEIARDRVALLRRSAAALGAVILHKGAPTMVAAPDGAFAVIGAGGPALASAGTGDVLAGIASALLASGHDPFEAASLGAWMHGRAGDRIAERVSEAGLLARDLLDELGPVCRELEDAHR